MTDRPFQIRILPSCPLFREKPRIYDARLGHPYNDAMDDATHFLVETFLAAGDGGYLFFGRRGRELAEKIRRATAKGRKA